MTDPNPLREDEVIARTMHARYRDWLRDNGSDTPAWDSYDMDPRYKQTLLEDARAAITALDQVREGRGIDAARPEA